MSELKTRFIDDTYVEYYNTGNHDLAQVYIKSEADTESMNERTASLTDMSFSVPGMRNMFSGMNLDAFIASSHAFASAFRSVLSDISDTSTPFSKVRPYHVMFPRDFLRWLIE